MTNVTEKNYAIVVFDILTSELLKTIVNSGAKSHVIVISPWVKDYAVPITWPSFTSNFFNITDMQTTSDIFILLLRKGVHVTILTKDPRQVLLDNPKSPKMAREHREFCEKIKDGGGKIHYTMGRKYNHGKLTWTSEHALIGSGNLTPSGLDPALQGNVGELIIKSKDERSHAKKLKWALESIEDPENEPSL